MSDTHGMSGVSGMAPSSRDRISVDLHGLRAALLAQARARGVTPSDLVRGVLAEALGALDSGQRVLGSATTRSAPNGRVRLSLRLTVDQARAIALAAKAAGLSTGDFVAGLVAGVPVLSVGASRTDHLAALIASSAEVSTLSRNIHHLTWLLRQGASAQPWSTGPCSTRWPMTCAPPGVGCACSGRLAAARRQRRCA